MGKVNGTRWVVAAAMLAATLPAAAAGWKLETGVTGRETYTDNVALTSTNRQSDFITEVNPYISASKKGARLKADFRYSMQNLFYADQSSRNRTHHQLAGRANAELVEEEIFLDANASISQQATSLLGPIAAETASATGNLTNVSSLTISPYWQHRFGTTANLLARYSHGETKYGGNGFSDASTDGVQLGLSSGSAFNDVFWGLNHSDQQTNYDHLPDVKFITTTGSLGYAISPRLRVTGTIGQQDHSYAGAVTALSGSLWNVGLAWAPTNRTNLSVGFGDNPIGNAYNFDFNHRTAYTKWNAGYAETLTTASNQFSGLLSGAGTSEGHGVLFKNVQGTVLSNAVFLNKRFQASVSYAKGKSDLRLSVFQSSQESQQSQSTILAVGVALDPFLTSPTIKQRGMGLGWNWRLSNVLTSNVGFSAGHINFVTTNRRDTYSNVQVGLTRTFNHDLSGSVSLRHQQRDSNAAGGDYTENAVTGAVNYKF